MSIKTYRPTTPARRQMTVSGFDGVDKRMDVIATAMRLGAKVTDLAELELCYAPPFGSAKDPVNMVGYVAENVITGKIGQFFWHDGEKHPRLSCSARH